MPPRTCLPFRTNGAPRAPFSLPGKELGVKGCTVDEINPALPRIRTMP